MSDQNFEIIGERVNQLSGTGGRRQGNYGTSTKPKMAVSSSYLLNRGGPVVVPVNNSGRATNSQAQALQKLKETKVVKVSVASRSAVESKPSRMVPNYAKLAHDEGFSSSTA